MTGRASCGIALTQLADGLTVLPQLLRQFGQQGFGFSQGCRLGRPQLPFQLGGYAADMVETQPQRHALEVVRQPQGAGRFGLGDQIAQLACLVGVEGGETGRVPRSAQMMALVSAMDRALR